MFYKVLGCVKFNTEGLSEGQKDIDKVLQIFASSCVAAGPNCTLNAEFKFASGDALLAKLDSTIDALYQHSVPINSTTGDVVTAANLRGLLGILVYGIEYWPLAASVLASAFKGNFMELAQITSPTVNPEDAQQSDLGLFAGNAIAVSVFSLDMPLSLTEYLQCADTKAYSAEHPPPTNAEIVDRIFSNLENYSRRIGENIWSAGLCHLWEKEGLLPKRSRYNGSFELADNVLQTPVLLFSCVPLYICLGLIHSLDYRQTYDGITPLSYAKSANDRLRNNARLIQTNGVGHTSASQPSLCTAAAARAYFLNGTVPTEKVTQCPVDVLPFQSTEDPAGLERRGEESVLVKAWVALAKKRPVRMVGGIRHL